MKVASLDAEAPVGQHANAEVEVPWRSSSRARFALTGEPDALATSIEVFTRVGFGERYFGVYVPTRFGGFLLAASAD